MKSSKPDAFAHSSKEAKDNTKNEGAVRSQPTKSQVRERELERYPVRQTQVYSNKSFPDRIYGKHELFFLYLRKSVPESGQDHSNQCNCHYYSWRSGELPD